MAGWLDLMISGSMDLRKIKQDNRQYYGLNGRGSKYRKKEVRISLRFLCVKRHFSDSLALTVICWDLNSITNSFIGESAHSLYIKCRNVRNKGNIDGFT